MREIGVWRVGAGLAIGLLLVAGGCKRSQKAVLSPRTTEFADNVKGYVRQPKIDFLHWPDVLDLQGDITSFYEGRSYSTAWVKDGRPTRSATAFITAFRDAESKGLRSEDYDGSMWEQRVQRLGSKDGDATAQFDVAMTVAVMRYVSDLHEGRVNPSHFNFEIDAMSKRLNLPQFLEEQATVAEDVPGLLKGLEPDAEEYRRTEEALGRYRELVKAEASSPPEALPDVAKALGVGETYSGAEAVAHRLEREGYRSEEGGVAGQADSSRISQALSDGLKEYQAAHGLTPDGKLTSATVKSLNVPMAARVTQMEDSLERWRWLPDPYLRPRLMVNLPEFVVRAYDGGGHQEFSMKVVVGKSTGGHDTPVFTHMMKYLIFRPFWNVPVDIAKKELVPHMERTAGYLEAKNYEVINNKGEVQKEYTTARVEHGGLLVREKPGPKNSLGLVKFMFPNQYDIYMHSTPEMALFGRTRRDYSHGCVRLQKADDMAVWVLNGQTDKDGAEWNLDRVHDAMENGPDNRQVNLKTQLPVVIFYLTAWVNDDGRVEFFDDMYGYDAALEQTLAKGRPYPTKPEPVTPTTKPGDTV